MGRRVAVVATVVAVLAVLSLSHRFGRAQPTGNYRPVIPADALTNGCFPLPGDVRFDFAYQVRSDGDQVVGGVSRRLLIGQYDRIDEAEARVRIVEEFVGAGFVPVREPAPYDAVLTSRDGAGQVVGLKVEQLPDLSDDAVVRGTFVLVLPPAAPPAAAPAVCDDPESTKRFVHWWLQWPLP